MPITAPKARAASSGTRAASSGTKAASSGTGVASSGTGAASSGTGVASSGTGVASSGARAAEPLRVAAGLLFDERGRVLIGARTPDRSYPGYWEFPGGKMEPGETALQSLARELREELSIEVIAAAHCITLDYDYPAFRVRLEFFTVSAYRGQVRGAESQHLQWVAIEDLPRIKLLDANRRVVEYLLRHKNP